MVFQKVYCDLLPSKHCRPHLCICWCRFLQPGSSHLLEEFADLSAVYSDCADLCITYPCLSFYHTCQAKFNPNSSVGHLCIYPWRKSHDLNTGALQIHGNRCWSPRAAHKSFQLSATNFFSGFPQPAFSGPEAKSCLDFAVRRTNNFSPV